MGIVKEKAKKSKSRSMKILRDTGIQGEPITLDIYVDDKPTMYHLYTDAEGEYRWKRADTAPDAEPYYVNIFNDQDSNCTCPAGQFGRACKHVAATRKLRERGVI